MILRLDLALGALDAERAEIVAQPRQRPLVQEAGEIIGAVGQQFAAAEPDEEVEVFALDALDASLRSPPAPAPTCATPSGVGIAAQFGQAA